MPKLERVNVLLPGQGTQSLDQPSVGNCILGRFARVVVPAATWAI